MKNGYRLFDRSSTLKTLLSPYTSGGGSLREVSIYPLFVQQFIKALNIYHLEASFIVIIDHLCPFNFVPFAFPEKVIQQGIDFLNCTLMRRKICTIWDIAKAFMIVILHRRVSLLADQLLRMFFTLSIFSEKMASPEHLRTL